MLDIGFRGYHHREATSLQDEDKRWVYGFLIIDENGSWIKCGEHTHSVDPNSIGQYIGLKDKDGVKIYAGDIVKYRDDSGQQRHGVVTWRQCEFYAVAVGGDEEGNQDGQLHPDNECEVIDNKYENPELLEVT